MLSVNRVVIFLVLVFLFANSAFAEQELVKGGGYGGNPKIGFYAYGQGNAQRPALDILRDNKSGICYMQNAEVVIKQWNEHLDGPVIQFNCAALEAAHANIYWNGNSAQADADFNNLNYRLYMISNDAFYYAAMTNKMFKDWFGRPILINEDGKPLQIVINIHPNSDDSNLMNNGGWDPDVKDSTKGQLTVGDGDNNHFYPFATLTFIAHELGHGFTGQNSKLGNIAEELPKESDPCSGMLRKINQSAALAESFSDMTAQALEFYMTGRNDWKFSAENTVQIDAARFMDDPLRDCTQSFFGASPGCSIDNIKNMNRLCELAGPDHIIDPQYLAGVFNKAFYLLSTSPNWNIEKAYKVMVLANQHYWKPDSDYNEAACGVIQATTGYEKEHGLGPSLQDDISLVKKVFAQVGIDTSQCI
jgi:pseudolysin